VEGGGLAGADFNGDHKLDLVVTLQYAGYHGSGNGFVILLGNGNGTFEPPQSFAQPKAPIAVAVGKLTKDGHPAIVLVPAGSDDVYLYHGDGAGDFSGPEHTYLPGGSGIAIGDVNGDGFPDLVTSGGYVAFGTASGTFTKPIHYPVQDFYGTYGLVLADLRKNGLTDIVTDAHGGISVLLSLGKGRYEDGVWTEVAGGAACGMTEDFNRDGRPDLAVNNGQDVAILLLGTGNAKLPLTPGVTIPLPGAACLVTGDLNGDGIPDLLVPANGTVVAYLGNGDGAFRRESTSATPSGGYVALGDFNHDGRLDFVTSGNLLALGNGDGTFQTPTAFVSNPPTTGFANIAVGDINNDGWPDVVLTNVGINPYVNVYVLLNDRNGGFSQVPTTFGATTTQAILADLNGDGNLDLILCYFGGATVYLGDGTGAFTYQAGLNDPVIEAPGLNMVADLNGDGIPDIAVLGSDTLAIYLGMGGATYAAPFDIGTGASPGDIWWPTCTASPPRQGFPTSWHLTPPVA